MDDLKGKEIEKWIVKSRRDLKAAQVLIANEELLLDSVVYHCQQSTEKALKGYLVFQDHELQKTHDLEVLANLCATYDSSFSELENEARILTPYAMQFRYPGDELEPDIKDAEAAIVMAVVVLEFVSHRLPIELSDSKTGSEEE